MISVTIRSKIVHYMAFLITVVFAIVALIPAASFASVKGRKNTAIGLGALSIFELARGHTGTGLVVGAGAAYAYKRYSDTKHHKHHRYQRTSRVYSRRYSNR
jgi:hypothetical protein